MALSLNPLRWFYQVRLRQLRRAQAIAVCRLGRTSLVSGPSGVRKLLDHLDRNDVKIARLERLLK